MERIEAEYKSDLSKLKRALKIQEKQKEALLHDIHSLSNKSKNLLPLDQLLSKVYKKSKKPTSDTLVDSKDKQGRKVKLDDGERSEEEDASSSSTAKQDEDERELVFGESEYYKKVFAVFFSIINVIKIFIS